MPLTPDPIPFIPDIATDVNTQSTPEARRAARCDLRAHLFTHIQELAISSDTNIRLRATLGGLRALAHLDALELRERRLAQHDKMIALAEKHIEIQLRREERAAATGGGSGSPSQMGARAGGRANSSPPQPEPLNTQELAEIEELTPPEIPRSRFRIPKLGNMWRGHLINARFWNAYWQGHKAAEDYAKGLPYTPTKIPGTTPISARPSTDTPVSEISDLKSSPATPVHDHTPSDPQPNPAPAADIAAGGASPISPLSPMSPIPEPGRLAESPPQDDRPPPDRHPP